MPYDIIAPGIGYVSIFGNEFARFGTPGGLVFPVPAGVHAITFQVFGAPGGRSFEAEGSWPPIAHSLNCPVSPGQVLTLEAGGPAFNPNPSLPTLANGPLAGGQGTLMAGAGGGASRLIRGSTVLAIGAGGGGWAYDPVTSEPVAPSNGWPTGGTAGAAASGLPADGDGPAGGGGAGAPPGDGGTGTPPSPGENGTSIISPPDYGGPTSPSWVETTLIDPEFRGALSGVRVFFFIPPERVGGWSLGRHAW